MFLNKQEESKHFISVYTSFLTLFSPFIDNARESEGECYDMIKIQKQKCFIV